MAATTRPQKLLGQDDMVLWSARIIGPLRPGFLASGRPSGPQTRHRDQDVEALTRPSTPHGGRYILGSRNWRLVCYETQSPCAVVHLWIVTVSKRLRVSLAKLLMLSPAASRGRRISLRSSTVREIGPSPCPKHHPRLLCSILDTFATH